jgi:two-component system, NarL family, sensor kinase
VSLLSPGSAAGPVAQFVVAGLAAVALFVVGSLLVLRELGRREAVRDAGEFAQLVGRGIVEPTLTNDVLESDPETLARLDRLVQERVLGDRIVRVKLWSPEGRIVYSDESRLVGATYELEADKREALRSGETHVEVSDLDAPENRFERGRGPLHEVYTRLRTPDGTPLLFETYQESTQVVATGRDIWLPFAAPLLAGLLLLWLTQVPLALRLARRLRRAQQQRESATADERRRIASDLHDGVVQDLAGVSYSLNAAANRAPEQLAGDLRDAASRTRSALRQLRTLLVAIHPPNLRSAGLAAALRDRLAPLEAAGVATTLDVPEELDVGVETEQLLFRAASEAVRNVERHSRASHVSVRVEPGDGRVRLEVADDGVGFETADRDRRHSEGHLGLSLLEDVAERAGREAARRVVAGRRHVGDTRGVQVIRLLIADDHAVVRTGLTQLLSAVDDVELVGAATDGEQAVALSAELAPDVVLMDLEMPALDGIEATRRIKEAQPEVAVVILTSFSDRERILRALDAGAAGYLLKDAEPDELTRAVRAAAQGDAPLDPRAGRALLSARTATSPADTLSAREREVLAMVAEGLPNKLIARELGISEKTVKAHLTSVFRRIDVTDRTQAALWAERNGVIRS